MIVPLVSLAEEGPWESSMFNASSSSSSSPGWLRSWTAPPFFSLRWSSFSFSLMSASSSVWACSSCSWSSWLRSVKSESKRTINSAKHTFESGATAAAMIVSLRIFWKQSQIYQYSLGQSFVIDLVKLEDEMINSLVVTCWSWFCCFLWNFTASMWLPLSQEWKCQIYADCRKLSL